MAGDAWFYCIPCDQIFKPTVWPVVQPTINVRESCSENAHQNQYYNMSDQGFKVNRHIAWRWKYVTWLRNEGLRTKKML